MASVVHSRRVDVLMKLRVGGPFLVATLILAATADAAPLSIGAIVGSWENAAPGGVTVDDEVGTQAGQICWGRADRVGRRPAAATDFDRVRFRRQTL